MKNILLLQLERNPSLFPDTFLGFVSQVIRESGFRCVRATLRLPQGEVEKEKERKLAALDDFMKRSGTDLVLYHNIFDRAVPGFIYEHNNRIRHACEDFSALDFLPPESVFQLKNTAGNVPRFDISGAEIKTNLFRAGATQLILNAPSYEPGLEVTFIGAESAPRVSRTQTIFADCGCRYKKPLKGNILFDGVGIPGGNSVMLGCSFCDKTHPAPMSRRARLDAVKLQLRFLRKYDSISEFHLFDESPWDILEELIRSSRLPGGTSIMIRSRLMAILKHERRAVAAIAAAKRRGLKIVLYLTGFENFSESELRLYNKEFSADQLIGGLELIEDLEAEFPLSFSVRGSNGFILFNPWTKPEDLRTNAENFILYNFVSRFCKKALSTKLRLRPGLPLYLKAAGEGRLLDKYQDDIFDSSKQLGYTGETPWVFTSDEVKTAFVLVQVLIEMLNKKDSCGDFMVEPRVYDYLLYALLSEFGNEFPTEAEDMISAANRVLSSVSSGEKYFLSNPHTFQRLNRYTDKLMRHIEEPGGSAAGRFHLLSLGFSNVADLEDLAPLKSTRNFSRFDGTPFSFQRIMAEEILFRSGMKKVLLLNYREGDPAELIEKFAGYDIKIVPDVIYKSRIGGDRKSENEISSYPWLANSFRHAAVNNIFIAGNPEDAEEAADCYASPDKEKRIIRMGQLLGYPDCCTRSYFNHDLRGSNTFLLYHALLSTSGRPDPLVNPIWGAIPHFPCSLDCRPSAAQAAAVLDFYREHDPDFSDRFVSWLSLPFLLFSRSYMIVFKKSSIKKGRFYYSDPVFMDECDIPAVRKMNFQAVFSRILQGDSLENYPEELIVFRAGRPVFRFTKETPGLNPLVVYD